MIPIYIGISHRFDCIKGMTERSILKHTSVPVKITYLYPEVEAGCTGFTNVRYTIRYGIYLDPDMIVLGDIAELWAYRRPGKFVCMQDGRTEVSVIDCEHGVRKKQEEARLPKVPIIPLEWNVRDAQRVDGQVRWIDRMPDNAKLLHFTWLDNQPWFHDHPVGELQEIYEQYK